MSLESNIPSSEEITKSSGHQKRTALRVGGGFAAVLLAGVAYSANKSGTNLPSSESKDGLVILDQVDQIPTPYLVTFPSPASSPVAKVGVKSPSGFKARPDFCNPTTLNEVGQVMGGTAKCYEEKPKNDVTASAHFVSNYGAAPIYFLIDRSIKNRIHEDKSSKFYIGDVACYNAFGDTAIMCHTTDKTGHDYNVDVVFGNQYKTNGESSQLAAIALKASHAINY